MKRAAVRCRHDLSWDVVLLPDRRAYRSLRGDHLTAGGPGLHPEQRGGPQRQRRMAVGRLFCFAMQSAPFSIIRCPSMARGGK